MPQSRLVPVSCTPQSRHYYLQLYFSSLNDEQLLNNSSGLLAMFETEKVLAQQQRRQQSSSGSAETSAAPSLLTLDLPSTLDLVVQESTGTAQNNAASLPFPCAALPRLQHSHQSSQARQRFESICQRAASMEKNSPESLQLLLQAYKEADECIAFVSNDVVLYNTQLMKQLTVVNEESVIWLYMTIQAKLQGLMDALQLDDTQSAIPIPAPSRDAFHLLSQQFHRSCHSMTNLVEGVVQSNQQTVERVQRFTEHLLTLTVQAAESLCTKNEKVIEQAYKFFQANLQQACKVAMTISNDNAASGAAGIADEVPSPIELLQALCVACSQHCKSIADQGCDVNTSMVESANETARRSTEAASLVAVTFTTFTDRIVGHACKNSTVNVEFLAKTTTLITPGHEGVKRAGHLRGFFDAATIINNHDASTAVKAIHSNATNSASVVETARLTTEYALNTAVKAIHSCATNTASVAETARLTTKYASNATRSSIASNGIITGHQTQCTIALCGHAKAVLPEVSNPSTSTNLGAADGELTYAAAATLEGMEEQVDTFERAPQEVLKKRKIFTAKRPVVAGS